MRAWTVHIKPCSPLTSFALHANCTAWKCIPEQGMKPANWALELGRKGKTAGNVHYLKCCRMRNRCWHGFCGVESHPADAASWQASLVSNPQLCKTHHHNWHPGWQSLPRASSRGQWNIPSLAIVPPPCTTAQTGKSDCTCLRDTHDISLSRAVCALPVTRTEIC